MGAASSVPTDGASTHPEAASSLLKAQGNGAYKAGLFGEAVLCYSSALAAVADELTAAAAATTAATGSEPRLLRATILSNRSAALLAAGQPELALADAEAAIAAWPSWSKGYYRAAAALRDGCPRPAPWSHGGPLLDQCAARCDGCRRGRAHACCAGSRVKCSGV